MSGYSSEDYADGGRATQDRRLPLADAGRFRDTDHDYIARMNAQAAERGYGRSAEFTSGAMRCDA